MDHSPNSTGQTPKLSEFFAKGLQHAKAAKEMGNDPWVAINPNDHPSQWRAWSAYFLTMYHALPVAWTEVEAGRMDSFTVPADDPVNFDLSYTPPASSLPEKPRRKRPLRFPSMEHVSRFRHWLSKRTVAPIEKINDATEFQRISRGFDELKKETKPAQKGLGMKNPHPLPQDRINEAAE